MAIALVGEFHNNNPKDWFILTQKDEPDKSNPRWRNIRVEMYHNGQLYAETKIKPGQETRSDAKFKSWEAEHHLRLLYAWLLEVKGATMRRGWKLDPPISAELQAALDRPDIQDMDVAFYSPAPSPWPYVLSRGRDAQTRGSN